MVDSNEMTLSLFESRFKNRQYIGSGGFAKVYKAFDHAKNHFVALKVADVRPELKQFTLQREVELVNKLPPHPNIARYDACYRFDMGVAGEIDFAILKFYEDGNLEQFINTHELTPDDIHIIIKGILRGVSFLHNNNYVHRDLKSQNILIQRDDGVWTPKITDFGLSRSINNESTANNSAIGLSYSYAAPEQIQNRRIYKNVDIWAVGVIIYRMVANELPFKSNSREDGRDTQSQLELSRKIVNAELPERLYTLPEPYQSIIKRCLISDPKLRCQNAEELLSLLDGEKPYVGNFQEEEDTPPEPVAPPAPTMFVPVPPEKKEFDTERTMLAPSAQTTQTGRPAMATASTTSSFASPPPIYTEPEPVRPPVQRDTYTPAPPPPPPPPPMVAYSEPKPDYTQIINRPSPVQAAPAPALVSGDPKGGLKWWYIVLPLLLIGAIVAYFLFFQEKSSGGYIPGRKRAADTYEVTRQKNEAAQGDQKALEEVGKSLESSVRIYRDDYRWTYELAKNKAFAGKDDEAFEMLEKSAAIASANSVAWDLERQLNKDAQGAFGKLSSGQSAKWKSLLDGLKRGN